MGDGCIAGNGSFCCLFQFGVMGLGGPNRAFFLFILEMMER